RDGVGGFFRRARGALRARRLRGDAPRGRGRGLRDGEGRQDGAGRVQALEGGAHRRRAAAPAACRGQEARRGTMHLCRRGRDHRERQGVFVEEQPADRGRRRPRAPAALKGAPMARQHRLDPTTETIHWGYFDAALPARLEVDSGDTVVIDTVSGTPEVAPEAHYRPEHREIFTKLKPQLGAHILTGPVAVRGALPGDTLEVRIKAIELTEDWGWSVIRPLRGTLPEDFPKFERWTTPIDRKAMRAKLAWGPSVPLSPFFGIVATAPRPEYGRVSSIEPREFGGNMDCKEFVAGTSLFLPVFVPGANFSAGDGHAVQGDCGACLPALETCRP